MRNTTDPFKMKEKVVIPDHITEGHAIADFCNAFMTAIGNDATVFSFMKTPALVTGR